MSNLWLATYFPAASASHRQWALFIAYPDRNSLNQGILLQTVDGLSTPGPQIFQEKSVSNLQNSRMFDKLEFLSALSTTDVNELRQIAADANPPDTSQVITSRFGKQENDSCQNWLFGVLEKAEEAACVDACASTLRTIPRY